jgi:hypothetical protein
VQTDIEDRRGNGQKTRAMMVEDSVEINSPLAKKTFKSKEGALIA